MTEKIRVRLISQIKKKDSDNWVQRVLKDGLTIILYPLILLLGVVIMFFALVISIFQTRDKSDIKVIEEPWTIWTERNGITLYKKYKGDIRFGPLYYNVKTVPTIPGLENKIFGDWFYPYGQGLFLQEWNITDKPSTTLTYLDFKEKSLVNIRGSINSVIWDIVEREDKKLELSCDTGEKIVKYEVEV